MKTRITQLLAAGLVALSATAYGQSQRFLHDAYFEGNVFLNDDETTPLTARIPTGTVSRVQDGVFFPVDTDITFRGGDWRIETNQAIRMTYKPEVTGMQTGVVINSEGTITLRQFVEGDGWHEYTLTPTNPPASGAGLAEIYAGDSDLADVVASAIRLPSVIRGPTGTPGTTNSIAFGTGATAANNAFAFGTISPSAAVGGFSFGSATAAGVNGFAAGFRAKGAEGSFVYASAPATGGGTDFDRTAHPRSFSVRASGGAFFETPSLVVTGSVSAATFTFPQGDYLFADGTNLFYVTSDGLTTNAITSN